MFFIRCIAHGFFKEKNAIKFKNFNSKTDSSSFMISHIPFNS